MESQEANNNTKTTNTSDPINELMRFNLAFVVLIFYLAIIVYLIFEAKNANAEETKWARYLFLFAGIEAIVFAAMGYVFGKDIGRKAEANAKASVKSAKEEKNTAQKRMENSNKNAQSFREYLIRLHEAVLSDQKYNQENLSGRVSTDSISSEENTIHGNRVLKIVLDQQTLLDENN